MNLTSKKFQGIVPGTPNAVKVNNGDISTALRIWKRQVKESNIVQDLFDNKFYKKKSVKMREQLALAKFNQKRGTSGQKT